ncbi:hypothetical protein DRN38_05610 [Thermococci archaeon]|nr:MAG: hypothetical protein DRN38_05610 [Thermococci archaeon]
MRLHEENKVVVRDSHNFLFLNDSRIYEVRRMGTNVKLNIPEDVLKTVGIERIIKMIERGYD